MNVTDAMECLKEKGYKHTGKREDMLHLFAKEKRYLSAKDVLEFLQPDYPGMSFDTIYRNLAFVFGIRHFRNYGIGRRETVSIYMLDRFSPSPFNLFRMWKNQAFRKLPDGFNIRFLS